MTWLPSFITVVAIVAAAAVFWIRRRFAYWKLRGIPYDEPHIIYGSMQGFRKTVIFQEIWDRIYNRFKGTGPFCGIFLFQRPLIMALDLQLIKSILIKDFANFADRGTFHNPRDDPLTGHLFALDGIKWKRLRQKMSPTFTSGKMKFMFPTVVEVADRFVEVFGDLCSRGEKVVEVKELLARFTTDVIGTCAFGIECNSLKDPNAEFRVMGRRAFQKTRHGPLISGFVQSNPKLAEKLRLRMIDEDVHQFFMRIVRETVEFREKTKVKRNDFMDLLVELKNTNAITMEDGEVVTGLTVEEVAAQAFVFFLAGFETSSTTMSFCLYELARHQDVQDRMREEINEVFAKHNQKFTYECMKDLRYMDQVLSETGRMYTIVPHLLRQAIDDYEIPGHPKYKIEKGTGIIIPSATLHRDPDLYPNPNNFDPDRFSPEMRAARDSVEFLTFGEGPRNCIGARFGKMQMRIGLGLLLKNFRFTVCEKTTIPMKYDVKSFVLGAEGGIYLGVERI